MKQVDGTEALARVRELRRFSTDAEKLLWSRLRGRRLDGFKFRRQVWLGSFIVDFLCVEAQLVVEADGSQHGDSVDYDRMRSAFLARKGYEVIRFWNNEVADHIDGVLTAIRSALITRVPSPSHPAAPGGSLPLPCREREL